MKFFLTLLILGFSFYSADVKAQATPTLTITSPSDGTVIKPGQKLTVSVHGANLPSGKEAIAADLPIFPSSSQEAKENASFELTIPEDISPGGYNIWAVETSASGILESPSITFKIAPNFQLDSVTFDNTNLILDGPGEQYTLTALGISAGVKRPIGKEFLMLKSLNPAIATVSAYGVITAISPGETQISVTYQSATGSAPVTGFAKVSVSPSTSQK